MLGAASKLIPISIENFHAGIRKIFEKKGAELININIIAFEAGRKACLKYLESKIMR